MNAESVTGMARAIATRVTEARSTGTPLRIVGAGLWLDAGRPTRASTTLDLPALAGADGGISRYEPGDLTLTAGAATPLAVIERATSAEGQWLPLQPFGSDGGTLGATIATASAGPLSSAYGTPREQLLGCEFVSGTGQIVRAGGHVVKNVAGFDLVRLMTGAWGTLGVLTEISVRLRALPEVDSTIAIPVDATAAAAWLRATEFTPLAAELLSPTLANALGVGEGATLLVRSGGNEALVRAATTALASLGISQSVPTAVWHALRTIESSQAAVLRVSTLPSRVGALWERASAIVERVGGFAHATLRRGVVRCVVPLDSGDDDQARLRGVIGALRVDGTCIIERLPAAMWPSLVPPAADDALSRRLRDAFDPARILNPGILGDGA